jgi:predicted transcriptional regulator
MTEKSFYFDPYAKGAGVFMGPTESRLMDLAWRHKKLTVKKAIFHLGEKNKLAYTTVMTVLGNLAVKGLLNKSKEGRLFSYSPAIDRDKFIKERVQLIQKCIKTNFGKT